MASDVSGNDEFQETFEGGEDVQESTSEVVVSSYDYSNYLENISNDLHFISALLISLILLIGLKGGLNKLWN